MDESKKVVSVTEKNDVPVMPKKIVKSLPIDIPEVRYRLCAYTSTGTLKSGIRGSVFMDMGRQHGDIIRSISSSRWMTLDEICSSVWNFERKMRHPGNRTKKAILDAVEQLVEHAFVARR